MLHTHAHAAAAARRNSSEVVSPKTWNQTNFSLTLQLSTSVHNLIANIVSAVQIWLGLRRRKNLYV